MLESNHKLNTYILKNPPSLDPAAQGSSLTEGKRGKRSKRATNGDSNGDRTGSPDNENNTSGTTDIVVEAPVKMGEFRKFILAISMFTAREILEKELL
jgi:translation initiation factor 5